MEMKRRDLLEHVYQLVDGMRSMCQLLECPGIPPITGDILVVFECVYDEVLRLVEEAMKLDDKRQYSRHKNKYVVLCHFIFMLTSVL